MSIFRSTSAISAAAVGSQPVSKIYLGSTQVWPSGSPPCEYPASLLLHFDGSDGDTAAPDSSDSAHPLTFYGSVQLSNTQARFGATSARFANFGFISVANGSGIIPATGDFTLEAWVYIDGAAVSSYHQIFGATGSLIVGVHDSGGSGGLFIEHAGVGGLGYGAGNVPRNQWSHVAVCHSGGTFTLFIDGVLVGTTTSPRTFSPIEDYTVGRWGSDVRLFNGYIDDLRVVPVALHMGDFTPPSAPLEACVAPPSTPASLLLHFDDEVGTNSIVDSSPLNASMTAVGTALISSAESKFGGRSWFNDSMVSYALADSDLSLGTGDFTVETWAYFTDADPIAFLLDYRASGTGSSTASWYVQYHAIQWFRGGLNDNYSFGPVPSFQWTHLAVVRSSGVLRAYIDGVKVGSDTADTRNYDGQPSVLGFSHDSTVEYPLRGYADDFRIVRGLAVYQSDFIPPAAALPANATVAPPAPSGTFLFSACVEGNLVGTYADGSGGRYTQTISAGSC